jgi:hypothetical protein
MGNLPFDDWEAEQLERDPDLRTAYDALEPWYQRQCRRIERRIAWKRKGHMGLSNAIRLGGIVGIGLTCGAIGYELWRLLRGHR